MPTYEYECTRCGNNFDIEQRFSDAALTTCEKCQGPLRKVFSSVGVVFKGSGFYKTDNRSSRTPGSKSTPSTAKESSGGDSAPSTPAVPSTPASSSES